MYLIQAIICLATFVGVAVLTIFVIRAERKSWQNNTLDSSKLSDNKKNL